MITVKIKRNEKKEIVSFELNGHAGYSSNGKDIVCAAVSAVTNMTLIGLGEELALPLNFKKGDGGYLKCELEDIPTEKMKLAQFLLSCMVIEYRDIENHYGKYIKVIDE
ncbi:MAG: ribosomal-processing cysteine protease Prp [Clostridia bacterium]|nr:ribosomal-processing cysteine protease Prp [Clostridia bacterium]